jgi:hypothetical protein
MLNHPELRPEIVSLLPTPDLSHMEEKLNFLKKNIYKEHLVAEKHRVYMVIYVGNFFSPWGCGRLSVR